MATAPVHFVCMKHAGRMVLEQPYRLFFPLGVLAGIWGALLWPAWYGGWLVLYPNEIHTRIMIEGFLAAFMLGFIGTAFPRLTGNRPWFGAEFALLLLLWGAVIACHLRGHVASGDLVFSALLLLLLLSMAGRWLIGHRDTPPPGFVLVFAGVAGGIIAAGYLGWVQPGPADARWARLVLFQGLLLLPLMGIGPYLLPRFFGMNSSHSFDDSPHPPAGWWQRTSAALTAGLLIAASFALELADYPSTGHLLRAGTILGWFALESPVLHRLKWSTTPATAILWGLHSLAAGCACAAFWPASRVGSLHLFFASGLGLITLSVGARVVLGHAGRHDLLAGKILWLRWLIGLVLLAALTRMTADFLPKVRVSHQIYAAWTWAAALTLWLCALLRFLLQDDEPRPPRKSCPRRRRS